MDRQGEGVLSQTEEKEQAGRIGGDGGPRGEVPRKAGRDQEHDVAPAQARRLFVSHLHALLPNDPLGGRGLCLFVAPIFPLLVVRVLGGATVYHRHDRVAGRPDFVHQHGQHHRVRSQGHQTHGWRGVGLHLQHRDTICAAFVDDHYGRPAGGNSLLQAEPAQEAEPDDLHLGLRCCVPTRWRAQVHVPRRRCQADHHHPARD
mmetsp:Transcript_341/g.1383  ORF Transcript_341/g.1383 Transcript_341/m.1383 type:complete len:203 (+) Transcript_341:837-1445(+)